MQEHPFLDVLADFEERVHRHVAGDQHVVFQGFPDERIAGVFTGGDAAQLLKRRERHAADPFGHDLGDRDHVHTQAEHVDVLVNDVRLLHGEFEALPAVRQLQRQDGPVEAFVSEVDPLVQQHLREGVRLRFLQVQDVRFQGFGLDLGCKAATGHCRDVGLGVFVLIGVRAGQCALQLEHLAGVFEVCPQSRRNAVDAGAQILDLRVEVFRDGGILLLQGVFGHREVPLGHDFLDQFPENLVFAVVAHDVTNVAVEVQPLELVHLVVVLVQRAK
ncbi:hypothetical protein D3C73_1035600 [compost metagenome]